MNDFPVSYLNGSELLTVGENFLPILKSIPTENDPLLQKLIPFLEQDIQRLSKVLSRNIYGKKIDTEDALFDQSFLTFRNYLVLMSKQESQKEIADAATKIVTIIKNVDWCLNRRSFAQELAGALAITDQLSKDDFNKALQTCNAQTWYEHFVKCYNNLKTAFSSRIDDVAEEAKNSPDLKDAKVQIKLHLGQAYNYIDMLSTVDSDKYGQYALKVDELIAAVIPGVRARKTRSQNESEEETEKKKEEAVV